MLGQRQQSFVDPWELSVLEERQDFHVRPIVDVGSLYRLVRSYLMWYICSTRSFQQAFLFLDWLWTETVVLQNEDFQFGERFSTVNNRYPLTRDDGIWGA